MSDHSRAFDIVSKLRPVIDRYMRNPSIPLVADNLLIGESEEVRALAIAMVVKYIKRKAAK